MDILSSKVIGDNILLTKTSAAQNEVALSSHRVRGLYFLVVIFAATIIIYYAQCTYYTIVTAKTLYKMHIVHLVKRNIASISFS